MSRNPPVAGWRTPVKPPGAGGDVFEGCLRAAPISNKSPARGRKICRTTDDILPLAGYNKNVSSQLTKDPSCSNKPSRISTTSLERSRLHHRAGLHRADLLVAVPEIPGRAGAGQADRSRTGGQDSTPIILDEPVPLGNLGCAQGQGRQARPQQSPDRR